MSILQTIREKHLWLKEQDVAEQTGISLSTLRKWRLRGINIPYHKLGKSVRYSQEAVDSFMASKLVEVR